MTDLKDLIYYWKITQLDLERFVSSELNRNLKETIVYLTELKQLKEKVNEPR